MLSLMLFDKYVRPRNNRTQIYAALWWVTLSMRRALYKGYKDGTHRQTDGLTDARQLRYAYR